MSFVDAAIVDVGDQFVAVPRPDEWRVIDTDGDWSSEVATLARLRVEDMRSRVESAASDDGRPAASDDPGVLASVVADAEGVATGFVAGVLREVLPELEPVIVMASVDEGEGLSLVPSVFCISVLEQTASYTMIRDEVIGALRSQDPDMVPVDAHEVELPDRTILRQASVQVGDDAMMWVRATFLIHLLAADTVVMAMGAAEGRDANIVLDVWTHITTEIAAVTSALPYGGQLVEAPR